MEEIINLLAQHVGQWVAVYVAGAFPNVVGGKVTGVYNHCMALDQEHVIAYVPFDRVLYITVPKQGADAGESAKPGAVPPGE
jgi:hypothetical protein